MRLAHLAFPHLLTNTVVRNGNVKLPSSSANSTAAQGAAAAASAAALGPKAVSQSESQRFPGSGNTLSSQAAASGQASAGASAGASKYPESSVSALTAMGVSREEALRLLDAAGGNVDMAADLMF